MRNKMYQFLAGKDEDQNVMDLWKNYKTIITTNGTTQNQLDQIMTHKVYVYNKGFYTTYKDIDKKSIKENIETESKDEYDDLKCSICCDYIEDRSIVLITECKHRFHADCIQCYMLYKTICPMCRTPIIKYEPPPPILPRFQYSQAIFDFGFLLNNR